MRNKTEGPFRREYGGIVAEVMGEGRFMKVKYKVSRVKEQEN